jgi:hypothetical protein
LAEELIKLLPSLNNTSSLNQFQFFQKVTEISMVYRKLYLINSFKISVESELDEYVEGVIFLLECLDLAMVTDREGIKARLLMPPAE